MADKMTVKQALKAIQTEVNYHAGSDTHYRAERLEQSLATLRAEIKRLEKDAGRLDWLMDNSATVKTDGHGNWHVEFDWNDEIGPSAENRRAAIDAAMKEQQP